MSELKRTQLYTCHLEAGASMVDFGGWEMPIQYPSKIVAEHLCTRTACSLFDVSHMGRVVIKGKDTVAFLEKVLSSDVASLELGRAQYCIIPNAEGGAVDDAYLYRFEEDHYFLVVNASNTDKDLAHFATILPKFNCTVTNMTSKCASIAVQGPDSDKILSQLIGGPVPVGPKKNDLGFAMMEGRKVWLSRTGYTGEPIGYELFIESAEAVWLWNRLIELGAAPIALGARDTLRLEAGLPLYGHEFGMDAEGKDIPIFAVPLSRFAVSLKEDKTALIGRASLEEQAKGVEKKMYFITLVDRGVMRAGMKVFRGEEEIRYITSGTMVPYMTENGSVNRSIGIAYLKSDVQIGDEVQIDVRGKKLKAGTDYKVSYKSNVRPGKATVTVTGNEERILLVSRFDNLGKGASGAAIQNMNLLMGVDETEGLAID